MTDSNANDYAKDKYDCRYKPHAVCPWCGYKDPDSWEYEEGETEAECPNCGKEFTVIAELYMNYTTKPKGGWPDDR